MDSAIKLGTGNMKQRKCRAENEWGIKDRSGDKTAQREQRSGVTGEKVPHCRAEGFKHTGDRCNETYGGRTGEKAGGAEGMRARERMDSRGTDRTPRVSGRRATGAARPRQAESLRRRGTEIHNGRQAGESARYGKQDAARAENLRHRCGQTEPRKNECRW